MRENRMEHSATAKTPKRLKKGKNVRRAARAVKLANQKTWSAQL